MTDNTDQRPVVRAWVETFSFGNGCGEVAIRFFCPSWDFRVPRLENQSVLHSEMATHTAALKAAAEAWAGAMGYTVKWEGDDD